MQNSTSRLTLAAVGDISFARRTEEVFHAHHPSYLFEQVQADLAVADLRFGNLESVLIPADFPLAQSSGLPLQSQDSVLEALRHLNFNILHQASNHVLDCGWRGLLHTYEQIRSLGTQPLGAGYSQEDARSIRIVEAKNTKIGFLGYLQAGDWTLAGGGGRIAYQNFTDISADIRKYRSSVDILIISLHGDIEFQPAPSIPRLELCRRLAEVGADLILCHHPHVPQGVEQWQNCLIHYSLGNFLFDINGYQLSSSPEVVKSQIFYVEIEKKKICGWRRQYYRLCPEEGGRPQVLSKKELIDAENYHQELDAILKNPLQLRSLWQQNCLRRLATWQQQIKQETELEPMDFLKKHGRVLFSDMAHEYLDGLYELAKIQYQANAQADFEFKRPFAPYESKT